MSPVLANINLPFKFLSHSQYFMDKINGVCMCRIQFTMKTQILLFSLLFHFCSHTSVLTFCHTSPIVKKFTLLCYFKQTKHVIQLMHHESIRENNFIYFWIMIQIDIKSWLNWYLKRIIIFNESTIEIKFTCQTVHPFKVCNSMVFSIFTELRNHHNNL